jgi:hypothetical protein
MTHIRGLLAAAILLATTTSCGGVSTSRQAAKDQATTRTCDRFDQCHLIGSAADATYPTREQCELTWQAEWDKRWPVSACEDKINQQAVETCYAAISGAVCNLAGFLIALGQCDQSLVCGAPDGGAK